MIIVKQQKCKISSKKCIFLRNPFNRHLFEIIIIYLSYQNISEVYYKSVFFYDLKFN